MIGERDLPAPPRDGGTGWRRGDVGLVALLAVFVAVAASWRLAGTSLWLDEASTWAISGHGLNDLARALTQSEADAGALYLLVAHGWLQVWGDSEVALRSLSVLCAAGTVPVFFAVARRLLDHTSALVATVLLALNPFLLEYARDARMYTFALLMCVAASYCLVRLLGDERNRWWALYALAATAAIYAHAFSMLVIAAHAGSLLCLPTARVNWPRITRAFGLTVLLAIPLFAYVAMTNGRGVGWIKPFSLQQVRELAVHMTGSTGSVASIFALLVAGAAILLVTVTGRRFGRSRQLWLMAFPLLCLLLPVAATALVSLFKPFFVGRYLFIALPGYALTLGVVFEWFRQRARSLSVVAVVAVVAISAPAIDRIWGAGMNRENWRAAESYIAANYQRGDGIVIPIVHVHPFGYYASRDPRLSATHPLWGFPYGPWTVAYAPTRVRHRWMRGPLPQVPTLWIVLRRPNAAAGLRISWRSPSLDTIRRTIRHDPGHTTTRSFHGIVVYRYAPS